MNLRPTRLCGEILSQKPHQRNKNNESTHCVLVSIVNLTGSRLTKETSVWANGEGVIYIKLLDGNSHISCGQHHSVGYEKSPPKLSSMSPNCKVYCSILKIVLPFIRKYRVRL